METVVLNNGIVMPTLGLGTYLSKENSCALAVETAIKDGYRLIDTAASYNNHVEVGNAIQKCIREGVVKRSDLFICTKLWIYDWHKEDVPIVVDRILKELQTDYVDLLLIHQSVLFNLPPEEDEKRKKGLPCMKIPGDDPKYRLGYNIENLKELWGAMEGVCREGKVRSIGVSNFSSKRIRDLMEFAEIKPVVNQVELHPYLQQWEVKEVCDQFGIYMMAYYPLGGQMGTRCLDSYNLMEDSTIVNIAKNHSKTCAQVMIRWAIQRGTICIPKSVTPSRIAENMAVFDFYLTDEEMAAIRAIDKRTRFVRYDFFLTSPQTWKDLWDGEYKETLGNKVCQSGSVFSMDSKMIKEVEIGANCFQGKEKTSEYGAKAHQFVMKDKPELISTKIDKSSFVYFDTYNLMNNPKQVIANVAYSKSQKSFGRRLAEDDLPSFSGVNEIVMTNLQSLNETVFGSGSFPNVTVINLSELPVVKNITLEEGSFGTPKIRASIHFLIYKMISLFS